MNTWKQSGNDGLGKLEQEIQSSIYFFPASTKKTLLPVLLAVGLGCLFVFPLLESNSIQYFMNLVCFAIFWLFIVFLQNKATAKRAEIDKNVQYLYNYEINEETIKAQTEIQAVNPLNMLQKTAKIDCLLPLEKLDCAINADKFILLIYKATPEEFILHRSFFLKKESFENTESLNSFLELLKKKTKIIQAGLNKLFWKFLKSLIFVSILFGQIYLFNVDSLIYSWVADGLMHSKAYKLSIDSLNKAIEIEKTHKNRKGLLAYYNWSKSFNYYQQNQFQDAKAPAQEALKLYKETKNQQDVESIELLIEDIDKELNKTKVKK
ncbi:MAG: tetratricopeptide repeat protein [Candidatus Caenarcaniphilales bacterium]|nr:tetratricopeptide repeat protein [Candidatus Caenarcaniphilales bacterium]